MTTGLFKGGFSILKFLLNLLQYCFWSYVLGFWPWGMWDLSSPTRDQTGTLCIRRWSLNHWTARERANPPFFLTIGPYCNWVQKFIDMDSVRTLYLIFKKLPLAKSWYGIKKESPYFSDKAAKISLLFLTTQLYEAWFLHTLQSKQYTVMVWTRKQV